MAVEEKVETGGRGRRGPQEPELPRRARERTCRARAPRRQDAPLPHPRPAWRPSPRRGLSVRPQPRPHRLPLQVVDAGAAVTPRRPLTWAWAHPRPAAQDECHVTQRTVTRSVGAGTVERDSIETGPSGQEAFQRAAHPSLRPLPGARLGSPGALHRARRPRWGSRCRSRSSGCTGTSATTSTTAAIRACSPRRTCSSWWAFRASSSPRCCTAACAGPRPATSAGCRCA